jgi:hypothetical protein
MNKTIAILAFAAAVTSTAVTAFADAPTVVTTREGLAAIANNLDGVYELGADIDLGSADWTPARWHSVLRAPVACCLRRGEPCREGAV